ncbi:MAG: SDR family NAD(P)-dependent oxidoreductase, partial [Chitinivibrionales bacterium]
VEKTLEKFGRIDILVNNAGRMVQFDVRDGIPDSADSEMALNLAAPLHLIKRFLPGLMDRPDAAIINVSSGYALWPSRSAPVYSATKAALHAFTKSLRWQLEGTSVKVFELIPPLVATESAVIKGGMTPDNFARLVVHKMEAGKEEILISEVRLLELGRRVWPALVDRVMKRR